MLKGISPIIIPELLKALSEMGHGDEILLADAHYPAHKYGKYVLRMDGVGIPDLLDAILPLFELDEYVDAPVIMMDAVAGDELDPAVAAVFRQEVDKHQPHTPPFVNIDKPSFYERSRDCHVVVVTGSTMKYGNVILKKGVTPL